MNKRLYTGISLLLVVAILVTGCAPADQAGAKSQGSGQPQRYGQIPWPAIQESIQANGGKLVPVEYKGTGDKGVRVTSADAEEWIVVFASRSGEPARRKVVDPSEIKEIESLGPGITTPLLEQRYELPTTGTSWVDVALGLGLGMGLGIIGAKVLMPAEKVVVAASAADDVARLGVGQGDDAARWAAGSLDDILTRVGKNGRLAADDIDELVRASRITEQQAEMLRNASSADETRALLSSTDDINAAVRALASGERKAVSIDFFGQGGIFPLIGEDGFFRAGRGGIAFWQGGAVQADEATWSIRLWGLKFIRRSSSVRELPGRAVAFWFANTDDLNEMRALAQQATAAAEDARTYRQAALKAAEGSGHSAVEAAQMVTRAEAAATGANQAALEAGRSSEQAFADALAAARASSRGSTTPAGFADDTARAVHELGSSPVPYARTVGGVPVAPVATSVTQQPTDEIVEAISKANIFPKVD